MLTKTGSSLCSSKWAKQEARTKQLQPLHWLSSQAGIPNLFPSCCFNRQSSASCKPSLQANWATRVDSLIRESIEHEFDSGVILSEESEFVEFGNKPKLRFIIDPVDGSTNWLRGLPQSALCIAALPIDESIAVQNVYWSIVCDLADDHPYVAVKGLGAWHNGQRLKCLSNLHSKSIISIELDKLSFSQQLCNFLADAGGIRSYCCTAMSFVHIAAGRLDAHLDVRTLVTPESYLASSLLLTESGGIVCGLDGKELRPFDNLTDRRSIIAASNLQLLREIIEGIA